MSDYRCIVLGINQYPNLSSFRYSQADCQSLRRFLEEMGGFSSSKSLSLIDNSSEAFRPTKNRTLQWVTENDPSFNTPHLWLFFKGYALSYQGEDYLLPQDVNLDDIVNTGISLRSLFSALLGQNTQSILVLLDVVHPPSYQPLGESTLTLAKQMGIPLIVSSQSQEVITTTDNSEQGLLTSALLEALWYYRYHLTLAHLDDYLRDRYWQYRLQTQQNINLPSIISPNMALSNQNLLPLPQASPEPLPPLPSLPEPATMRVEIGETEENNNTQTPQSRSTLIRPKTLVKGLIAASGLTLVVSLLLLRWLSSRQPSPVVIQTPDPSETTTPSPELSPEDEVLRSQARTQLVKNQASDFNRAIGDLRSNFRDQPLPKPLEEDISRWSEVIYDIAQGRAKIEQFKDAIAAAQLIPSDQIPLSNFAQEKIQQWQQKIQKQQKNQILIEAAQGLLIPNQASSYNRAITVLKQISPDEPSYPQAQQLIEQWSQEIYQIAQNRANQNNFLLAIETAKLVPENTIIYGDVQNSISVWQSFLP